MGLFGWICKGIKWVAKKIFGSSSERVSKHESVSHTSSTVSIEEMSTILRQFTQSVEPLAQKYEKNVIKDIIQYFDHTLADIMQDEMIRSEINERELRREQQNMVQQVRGFITGRVFKKISLDNPTCRKIIAMPPSDGKKEAMDMYSSKVLQEALHDLTREIASILTDQTDMITQAADSAAKRKVHEVKQQGNTFRRMAASWKDEEADRENDMLEPQLTLYLVNRSRELL